MKADIIHAGYKSSYLRIVKHTAKKAIVSSKLLARFFSLLTGKYPRVFIYHRFAPHGAKSPHKMPADVFRRQLEMISEKYRIMTLADCVEYFNKKKAWPKKTAVITIDDGYRDFYQWAYPELKRLYLPATFYVAVNFVGKKTLLWYDRLHYAVENTSKKSLQIGFDGSEERTFPLNSPNEKFTAWKALSDLCIASQEQEKWDLIALVESTLGITVPDIAPADYASVSWDEVRQMSNNGIEIGSHTLNHPILSKIPIDQLKEEIISSKHMLEEKLSVPVLTFSYPNGMPADINEAVVSTVRDAGYTGAPVCSGIIPRDPFRIPRMGASRDMIDFAAKLYGLEHAGQLVRKAIFWPGSQFYATEQQVEQFFAKPAGMAK